MGLFDQLDIPVPLALWPACELLSMQIAITNAAHAVDNELLHGGERLWLLRLPCHGPRHEPARRDADQGLGDTLGLYQLEEILPQVLGEQIPVRLSDGLVLAQIARAFHGVFGFAE